MHISSTLICLLLHTTLDNHPRHCLPHTPHHPPPLHTMADRCQSLCWYIFYRYYLHTRKNARPASFSHSFARHWYMQMYMPITRTIIKFLRHSRPPEHLPEKSDAPPHLCSSALAPFLHHSHSSRVYWPLSQQAGADGQHWNCEWFIHDFHADK